MRSWKHVAVSNLHCFLADLFFCLAPWLRHALSNAVQYRARYDGATGIDVPPHDREVIAVVTELFSSLLEPNGNGKFASF